MTAREGKTEVKPIKICMGSATVVHYTSHGDSRQEVWAFRSNGRRYFIVDS